VELSLRNDEGCGDCEQYTDADYDHDQRNFAKHDSQSPVGDKVALISAFIWLPGKSGRTNRGWVG
jgi:hypothetical protein